MVSLLTILVTEYGVKDVPNIATGEQEDVAGFLFGRLMAEKRDSRRVPNGVEESRTDPMSWTQHRGCHVWSVVKPYHHTNYVIHGEP